MRDDRTVSDLDLPWEGKTETSLRDRLDAIVQEIIVAGRESVGEQWELKKYGMWRSGLEVLKDYPELEEKPSRGGRGVETVSLRTVADQVGRGKDSIKRWIDLVQHIAPSLEDRTEEQFRQWAIPQRAIVEEKWATAMLPSPPTPLLPKSEAGKYRIIYADPPWKYGEEQHSIQDTVQKTVLQNHYPSMTLGQICALDIIGLADSNAVLFLWTTCPKLEEAFEVIKAWGFTYKAQMIWDKIKHNVGHYVSVRHELLLIATRGSCLPDIPKLFDSVQSIERGRHSEKPEEFRRIIDTLYSHGKRIELFARKTTENWDAWGNEVS